MKKAKKTVLLVLLVVSVFVFIGCGKKKADPEKPVAQVKADAEKMDVKQLQEMKTAYEKALDAKKVDVEKMMAELKKIPLTEIAGKEAAEMKADIDTLNKTIAALSERMKIYADKLIEKSAE